MRDESRRRRRRSGAPVVCAVGALLASSLACTLEPEPLPARAPRVVGTLPAQAETGVPRNAPVSFWFDRPLDPATITGLAIDVTSHEVRQSGRIHYDPVAYRLTYHPRGSYRRSLAYDAVIEHERLRGLRAGLPVAEAQVTFVTGVDEELPPPPVAEVSYAGEVLPLLEGRCAFAGCHAGRDPAASLDLSGAEGLRSTAIGRRTVLGWPGWPRIEAGSAAWSYLVYKVDAEETVVGRPMPPLAGLGPEEVELLARWIDEGAKVDGGVDEP